MFVTIKVTNENEIRRLQVEKESECSDLSFAQLQDALKNAFPGLKNKIFSLTWFDEEGDMITVSSDAELTEAIRVQTATSTSALRFSVKVTAEEPSKCCGAEPAPSVDAVHIHVSCDECGMSPIVGARFKCTVRDDFDLCAACEARREQPYPMIKITDPSQAPTALVYAFNDDKRQGEDRRPHHHRGFREGHCGRGGGGRGGGRGGFHGRGGCGRGAGFGYPGAPYYGPRHGCPFGGFGSPYAPPPQPFEAQEQQQDQHYAPHFGMGVPPPHGPMYGHPHHPFGHPHHFGGPRRGGFHEFVVPVAQEWAVQGKELLESLLGAAEPEEQQQQVAGEEPKPHRGWGRRGCRGRRHWQKAADGVLDVLNSFLQPADATTATPCGEKTKEAASEKNETTAAVPVETFRDLNDEDESLQNAIRESLSISEKTAPTTTEEEDDVEDVPMPGSDYVSVEQKEGEDEEEAWLAQERANAEAAAAALLEQQRLQREEQIRVERAAEEAAQAAEAERVRAERQQAELAAQWAGELQLLQSMGFSDLAVMLPLLQTYVQVPSSGVNGSTAGHVEGMQRVVATLLAKSGLNV